ncbi:hypothetical protein M422DRAFT_67198 [Sphaerobolus stellatus SS14]|uniref:Unplaced genomic scaffold SPHSTscaffold_37, whole genome shotgun sequence n=1 Tax=Sphaerobolus stellatus (strain SS14) TaxID=990650 RepID=A0A0C9VSI5_SPHS4|nr:hypothetical protein M422DRAFT_67198 [Sphaerobolus stellatus SS14]
MKFFTIATLFSFATLVISAPPFDPAGVKNIGNGHGGQFIGGQCLSDADCGSGCCANPTGICSGPGASTQNGKTGCGFGGGAPAPAPPAAPANAGGPPFDPAGAPHVGNGQASTQNGKTGCGFDSKQAMLLEDLV